MSPWASTLVPVRKKNGKLRICVDFRAVNNVTKKDSFPLQCIADTVNHYSGSKYFSSLDLLCGYHQILLSTGSKEITAFSMGDELYQYMRRDELYTLSGRIGKVDASHAAVARSSPAECTDLYYARCAQEVLPMRVGVRPVHWIYRL